MRGKRTTTWVLLLIGMAMPGCNRYLVSTPNLHQHQNPYAVYEATPPRLQTADAPVLYATDRAVVGDTKNPSYGAGRSTSLAFGVANVRLDPRGNWQELIRDSTQVKRSRDYALQVVGVQSHGRIHANIEPIFGPAEIVQTKWTAIDEVQRKELHELLVSRLAETPQKDVYIFVHGFNNTFDDAVFRAAEVWHFMGRVGVPIAYTWPAGHGGIRGYAYDRESGEFTVSHLRRFIKLVADCPEVERVHLIAHSRGVDVTISALRELHIACRAQGKSTPHELKLENLVLAAPDIDEEVFMQRFVGEHMLSAAKRMTIYVSEHDKAIELSDVVFASRRRLGMLAAKDFSPKMRRTLAKMPNVHFIDCKVSGLLMSHSYVFTHPAALSDLILLLRDRRDPGVATGRPLRQTAEGIWELADDYLAVKDARR